MEHYFAGDPGGLGVVGNGYGTVALLRRSLLDDPTSPWPTRSRLAAARPAERLRSAHRLRSAPARDANEAAGQLERNPPGALLVAEQYERVLPDELRSLARLAAGLAADAQSRSATAPSGMGRRSAQILRTEGLAGLTRRAARRALRRKMT